MLNYTFATANAPARTPTVAEIIAGIQGAFDMARATDPFNSVRIEMRGKGFDPDDDGVLFVPVGMFPGVKLPKWIRRSSLCEGAAFMIHNPRNECRKREGRTDADGEALDQIRRQLDPTELPTGDWAGPAGAQS